MPEPTVRRLEELPWVEPPGHFGAYSKLLVNPETTGTERLDCAPDVRIRAARETRISARLASKSSGFSY